MNQDIHDVIVIGGGVSGTALFYALSKYTNIQSIALVEKYASLGSVNSHPKNNSQSLHVGDIEINYSLTKVKQVKPAAMMIPRFVKSLTSESQAKVLQSVSKMILAVGEKEVDQLKERYISIKKLFPSLVALEAEDIRMIEPVIMEGRNPKQPVFALYNTEGYAVNFAALARVLADEALKETNKKIHLFLKSPVQSIKKISGGYAVETNQGILKARVVIVDTDAHSLAFAKRLGYGKEFSLIPIAGTFYFSPPLLKGKVYTMQEPQLPFAAVHGDPDLTRNNVTRWGPTARFWPVLESRNLGTMLEYFQYSGLHKPSTWASFFKILLSPLRFKYLLKNILYEIPFVGKYLFAHHVRKIVPALKGKDLTRATNYGGMRLQRVDTNTKELLLGEGKIIGENIIFNMTPSPGASVCLYNAGRDVETIMEFLHNHYTFDRARWHKDLGGDADEDVSLESSYAS
ncbi:MAG: FAD-dependent oxidoreductase [Candidatus Magasanikbacteria bacterium]|nr:FAD-dependent oxidoreductase [Candidatus Magasanikbacteria bacterium]